MLKLFNICQRHSININRGNRPRPSFTVSTLINIKVTAMVPKLYIMENSPAVRFVLLTAKALGVTLESIPVDLAKGEHLTSEYLKMNPQHTVPTFDDDGKIICDSHAISIYLVEKYGKDDSLYPKDPYKRAIVNQRLHFNSGVMFFYRKQIFRRLKDTREYVLPPESVQGIIEGYEFLEKFLEGHQWVAGDTLTIADFCLIPTVTYNDTIVPIDENKFLNIKAWVKRAEAWPYYSINQASLDYVRKMAANFFK